jgi:hypothetical protein
MKTVKANYQKGRQYYYVDKSLLACAFLFGGRICLRLHSRRKDAGKDAHRVHLEIIRTQAEAAWLRRKWKRRNADFAKKLAAHVGKMKGGAK